MPLQSIQILTPPASLPISLDEAKEHLRVTFNDEDTFISRLIGSATERVENLTGRALIDREVKVSQRLFYPSWKLPLYPFKSETELTYYDEEANALQTVDAGAYSVTNFFPYGCFVNMMGDTLPSVYDRQDGVSFTYVAGEETIPQSLLHAILLLVGDGYERREEAISGTIIARIPEGVNSLIRPWKLGGYR
jgi:uncharacterized phiE125 gp8 family phage protein